MPPKREKKKKSNYTKMGKPDKTANLEPQDQIPDQKSFFYSIPNPKFITSFLALLKKNLIVRRRTSSTFVTMFLVPFFILPLTNIDLDEKPSFSDIRRPVAQDYYSAVNNISMSLEKRSKNAFGLAPNTKEVKSMFNNFQIKPHYYNSTYFMVNAFYKYDTAAGYYFWNSKAPDFCINPEVAVATKDFKDNSVESMIVVLYERISSFCNFTTNVIFHHKQYAGKVIDYKFTADNIIATYMMLPIISLLGTEASFLMKDRANGFINSLYLGGCSRFVFWSATIVTSIICCLPACLIMSFYLTSESILIDSDMSVIFVFFFLFSISSTFSVFLLSLAVNNDESQRSVKLPMTVVSMLFSIVSGFLKTNQSEFFITVLTLFFPQIAYTQGLTSVFASYRYQGPVTWNNFYSGDNYAMTHNAILLVYSNIFYAMLFFIIILYQETHFVPDRIKALLTSHPRDYFKNDSIVLKATGLRKNYGEIKALNGVNFELEPGDVVAIIGPNGSGKSTLIGTMTNTLVADDGRISLFGHDSTDVYSGFEEIKQCSGVCFQGNTIVPELSIRDHLSLFGTIRGLTPEQIIDRTDLLLSSLQLTSIAEMQSLNLSGGQKRKLCIAIALLSKPPIIVLDEPTAGVDFEARQNIWKVLASQKESVCMITSHALEESEQVCNKIFVMSKGEIKKKGSATELRSIFKCGYVLRVVNEEYDKEGFLAMLRSVIDGVTIEKKKNNTYHIPIVEDKIATFVKTLESRMREFGVDQFTFTIDALEEVLLRIVQEEDQNSNIKTRGN
ncbi:ABC transporter family protein [Trichomonas vaginalis G3]|uniref:ABC transporter family protein n=1 Tax=Trichomonas vaginalis (strain ATCC PRA-98 / G3) TaxID=412133 RepID=A2DIH4_TRIV3|nr:ATPase activity, coupled to transmembrane movement of substances [Trichomonas vaginalis G3]EAY19778.1 ABC transporter family protein [Trichomonas vaginalis G3]KAI5523907.1 ATPase activity, coupled to transmembrane movement of substances [Trichomonas vaginalis G3]|eukprot:XP_001580764.1 ABC transporter family protein [Trichomonas vaginalis G3]